MRDFVGLLTENSNIRRRNELVWVTETSIGLPLYQPFHDNQIFLERADSCGLEECGLL